ncbi:MAG: hypothetical protein ACLR8G_02445 [Faecalibacterium prausnitzii]
MMGVEVIDLILKSYRFVIPLSRAGRKKRARLAAGAARAGPLFMEKNGEISFIAIFKNSAHRNGIFAICSLRMLLGH